MRRLWDWDVLGLLVITIALLIQAGAALRLLLLFAKH
jgi:hypothetical protein